MDLQKTVDALNRNGFLAQRFDTVTQARDAALAVIGAGSVGVGGSKTIGDSGLIERLAENGNTVYSHTLVQPEKKSSVRQLAMGADTYLLSANAVTEDGTLFFIEGTGNRLAAMLFGPETVILIAGRNKLVPNAEAADIRTRTQCCPNNARRLGLKTPCALTDRCAECRSEDSMCRAFLTLAMPSRHVKRFFVYLVDEDLGW